MEELKIVVPPTLRPDSKILIVGEAPGKTEVERREGFVGNAGRVLDKILVVAGLSRESVSLTNVVKRPPVGGFDSDHFRKDFYETKTEIIRTEKIRKRCRKCNGTNRQHLAKHRKTACDGFEPVVDIVEKRGRRTTGPTQELQMYVDSLRREINETHPSVVIAAGGEALKALCGVDSISKYRGSVLGSTLVPGVAVVPILHPAAILRGAQWQEIYISGRIVAEKVIPLAAAGGQFSRRSWQEFFEPTVEDVRRFLAAIDNKWVLDIETRAGTLACIGIASVIDGVDSAMCIPIHTTTGSFFTPAEELKIWQLIGELMNRNPLLIGQNITYDLDYLLDYGLCPSGLWMDTMLGFHLLYAELPKGLDFLTMKYTDIPYYKDEGKTWGSRTPDADLWRYNVKDVVATLRVAEEVEKELVAAKLSEYFHGYMMEKFPLALEMQQLGFDVDLEEKAELRRIVTGEIDRVHQQLVAAVGEEINVGSPAQVVKLLYTDLRLPPKFKRGTKLLTADEDALMELIAKFPDRRELKLIMAERHLRKSLESYIDAPLQHR